MHPITEFSLRRMHQDSAEIVSPAHSQPALVPGGYLEAQLATGDGFLIITTDWDAFEAALYLRLFDRSLQPVDAMALSAAYHSGSFQLHRAGPGETVEFSYFPDDRWRLEVIPRSRWLVSRAFSPAAYESGLPARHRLKITRLA